MGVSVGALAGREIGKSSSSVYVGAGTSRCGALRCWSEILDFAFFLSGLPWDLPGIFDDESEEDKKQNCAHIWNQTPNGAGAIGLSSPLWPDRHSWKFEGAVWVGRQEDRGAGRPWELVQGAAGLCLHLLALRAQCCMPAVPRGLV